ncbi:hypothetical protein BJ138DRAFT_1172491 [Hygrophoropsis aurantiaca]|uniref:Uncharacterized protein n=1 Tax=Hygrophoropsis aurantiaca TaxID=72124 RepID=A0ACB8AEK6_9AGAM|nr:hypothetical protein BJ138DRAFT_1172491 [Hygrophoropsis aurantiaca]
MTRLRRDTITPYNASSSSSTRTLRIMSTGTIFNAYTLTLATHPASSTASRAQAVESVRGGSAGKILALLSELGQRMGPDGEANVVEGMLVASLGDNTEARVVRAELERRGVSTRYCKIWPGKGVPCAWVMHALDANTRTVINHNPLPEVSHEDFIALLGPLLAPENYPAPPIPPPIPPRASPAPFDWLHFEARNIHATLANMLGVDGLARERHWRAHCVFSLDLARRPRDAVQSLIPHADVIFVALPPQPSPSSSRPAPPTPRAALLALARVAPPHALLIAYCGRDGAALLSVPTREYLQSSAWAPPAASRADTSRGKGSTTENGHTARNGADTIRARPRAPGQGFPGFGQNGYAEVESVRSGSDFWAAGGRHSPDSSGYTYTRDSRGDDAFSDVPSTDVSTYGLTSITPLFSPTHTHSHTPTHTPSQSQSQKPNAHDGHDDDDDDPEDDPDEDTEGAQDAFVAGMIYALSRRLVPGAPYTPTIPSPYNSNGGGHLNANGNGTHAHNGHENGGAGTTNGGVDTGRWRLDECLRFATELARRKARWREDDEEWKGLVDEMRRVGWSA